MVQVQELMFRSRPDVVDADLAGFFGSIPHADLQQNHKVISIDHGSRACAQVPASSTPAPTGACIIGAAFRKGSPLLPLLANLLKSLARRIVDRRVLHLIKMWLECPVESLASVVRRLPPLSSVSLQARKGRGGLGLFACDHEETEA